MQVDINVQKYSEDEWVISSYLDGNINSNTVVIMGHDAGLDYHENGVYPVIENDKIKKVNEKIQFTRKEYGNYDILTNTLKLYTDYAILRYDLRNHGNSLINGEYDRRDFLYERNALDLDSIITFLQSNYGYKNFIFIGTGISCLIMEYYLVNKSNDINVLSCIFISPTSSKFYTIEDSKYAYLYQKKEYINKENKQFNKIKGIFEGKKTIEEAINNINIEDKYGFLNIPTMYILGIEDKLTPLDIYIHILEGIRKVNKNIDIYLIKKDDNYGNTDHAFYDRISCDEVLKDIYFYIKRRDDSNDYKMS